ncbi:NAD(P)-dependent oxidoreductase [Vibrio sp. ABG19]|uniref:NAD(P)-dependent oxidoreductase n=1 Tax=Vibrio sp. ABG19 TaxID=2817385 RepID=UPI00249DE759|nr:NAD(P)-dependent oxidoreductase [Vibrio sp. ABG19]WGY45406.1 NAD(P)-dependent oxidoreductase [Vibrio sp. ABG19]
MKRAAFIGLGVMGAPMAGHLALRGFETCVYNRNEHKAINWLECYPGRHAVTPSLAAQDADVVLVCVGNDDDVRSVVYGPSGVLGAMRPGSTLIDHTTTSAELAQELARACSKQGVHFIDAPVSGGQVGAEQGALTVMCGGEEAVFTAMKPVFDCYARQATLLGEHGQGQRCKMVNQICIAGVLKGLSEALLVADAAGLDIGQVVEVLKQGAAGSWQLENRALTMSQQRFDFGFAIDWMRKDLAICLAEAERHQLTLPLTAEVDRQYQILQQQGLGRMDTSVLIKACL